MRHHSTILVLLLASGLSLAGDARLAERKPDASAQRPAAKTVVVTNRDGASIATSDGSSGRVVTLPVRRESGATGRRALITPPDGGTAQSATCPTGSTSRVRAVPPDGSLLACSVSEGNVERTERVLTRPTRTVDPTGAISGTQQAATGATLVNPVTIDRMTTESDWYWNSHAPGGALTLLGFAVTYELSDGSSWNSGAGSGYTYQASLDHVEVDGNTVRYVLVNPGLIYRQTDYNSGEHSAQGSLAADGDLVLEATIGSTVAVLRGGARVASNVATDYGDRFNYYSAIVGAVVPFEITYTISGATWTPDVLDQSFEYRGEGWVDFAHPLSTPPVQSVSIHGTAQVPGGVTAQYRAVAAYPDAVTRDVTSLATWSVSPGSLASVSQGLLSTQPIATDREPLALHVDYTESGITVRADKTVLLRQAGATGDADDWGMYQANAAHSGFIPLTLEPDVFSERWQRTVGSGAPLNPVTAADGKVFVSVLTYFGGGPTFFALDARDGETLWSKDFGEVFSVNPPSHAYGNVYIQTGNHASETYLHAYDANTGEVVFDAPHAAQWERYFAPTIFDGTVYVDGGYYGGMYAFDAFSGQQRWFFSLPQYDQWTPAVDAQYAYAYVGAGLSTANRFTGAPAFSIPDPGFDWNGWSMDLAPVLGGHDDVIAIHDGRLIRFDLPARSIRYELSRAFVGQPSVAGGKIYAIDAGALVVLDQETGSQLWTWRPGTEALQGALIVTNTHVLATSATTTYAVDLLSGEQQWSYPAAGELTLGDETLYIASPNGTLTAISVPEYTPAALDALEILGPAEATEDTTVLYTAMAHYGDGRARNRTLLATWSLEPAVYASFTEPGLLSVTEMLDPTRNVVLRARYTEGTNTVEATKPVTLQIAVTLREFLERNLLAGEAAKEQILVLLNEAIAREQAVLRAATPRSGAPPRLAPVTVSFPEEVEQALVRDHEARTAAERSIESLRRALLALPFIHLPLDPHFRE